MCGSVCVSKVVILPFIANVMEEQMPLVMMQSYIFATPQAFINGFCTSHVISYHNAKLTCTEDLFVPLQKYAGQWWCKKVKLAHLCA